MTDLLRAETFLDGLSSDRLAGDVDALASLFTEDAVFSIVGVMPELKGRAAIRAALAALIDDYPFLEWKRIGAFVNGNELAARHRLKVRHRASGQVAEMETCEFMTMRDGKCASFVQFTDSARVAAFGKS